VHVASALKKWVMQLQPSFCLGTQPSRVWPLARLLRRVLAVVLIAHMALQGGDLPTSADISIVLPPYPQYERGHLPPVNLTAVAILASQILQVGSIP